MFALRVKSARRLHKAVIEDQSLKLQVSAQHARLLQHRNIVLWCSSSSCTTHNNNNSYIDNGNKSKNKKQPVAREDTARAENGYVWARTNAQVHTCSCSRHIEPAALSVGPSYLLVCRAIPCAR